MSRKKQPRVAVIIPFRDRRIDSRRVANLEIVHAWWYAHGYEPQIVDDGLPESDQFNRHKAYNRAVSRNPDADVFVFSEADMLIHPDQIARAVGMATAQHGLVVPFSQYRYLSDKATSALRDGYYDQSVVKVSEWWGEPVSSPLSVFSWQPESVMDNGKSIGAVNVVSRETLKKTGGFTEATSGNWYDDNIIEEGFAYLTGNKTRWVEGPAVHMYHLPGWKGDHLTEEDRRATQRNKDLLNIMRRDIRMGNRQGVIDLMSTRA